jgi:hypothetical protein
MQSTRLVPPLHAMFAPHAARLGAPCSAHSAAHADVTAS